jgi:hypothetical protein
MSPLEDRLSEQIVHKTSLRKGVAIASGLAAIVTYALAAIHAPVVLIGVGVVCIMASVVAATRRQRGFRFLPEGIEELGPRGASTLISYADIAGAQRVGDEVLVSVGGRVLRLGRYGSREPYVNDIITELVTYLEANIAEARALAEDRAAVVAFLARGGPTGDDYRHAPAPRSALEAVARSRVMPARLRVDAARALGEGGEELLEEASNASENERRRV